VDSESQAILSWERPDGGISEVLREDPLVIVIGQETLVTMRTPGHDRELVTGFLLSERIVPSITDILGLHADPRDGIARIRVELSAGTSARRGRLTRVQEIRASCGLCGVPSVDALCADLPKLPQGQTLSLIEAARLAEAMRPLQGLFLRTGASHAAALAIDGKIALLREDVGRHNAVDKVLGAALQAKLELSKAALVLSGRGGFELVLKALRLGVGFIISVSAPSAFAVQLADEAGATLLGFARGESATIYTDAGRVKA
jgi:FdhD protein